MIEQRVATLSGGEKARLVLALIALTQPALLILDEPTNHLDLEMREALVLALQDYTGALILVSHDRSLLHRTVDELWLVDSGKLHQFAGGLDDYTALRRPTPAKSVTHGKGLSDEPRQKNVNKCNRCAKPSGSSKRSWKGSAPSCRAWKLGSRTQKSIAAWGLKS